MEAMKKTPRPNSSLRGRRPSYAPKNKIAPGAASRGVRPVGQSPYQVKTTPGAVMPGSFNPQLSLKQGFSKEEHRGTSGTHEISTQGGSTHDGKKRKRGPMGGAFSSAPPLHTF